MGKHNIIEDAKKITVKAEGYHIWKEDLLHVMQKYKKGKYDSVRNYYKEARELGYLDRAKPYAKELNRILWGFLLANKKSRNDLEILDTTIEIFNNTTNTLKKIENSEEVSEYLCRLDYKSYLDFAKHLSDKYGIDAEEYMQAKSNGFKTNEDSPEDDLLYEKEPLFNSVRTTNIIMPIFKENKEEFLRLPDDDYSVLKRGLKQKEIFPLYKQNYGLPPLQVIKSTKIVLEFSILDDKAYIDDMIKEVYKREKRFRRATSSSEKSGLLKALNCEEYDKYDEYNEKKFKSINALQKALIIYQYTQDGEEILSLKEAQYIFTFHAFLFTYHNKLKNIDNKHDINSDTYRSRDVITYYFLKKEIKEQIEIMESLLNLNS